MELNRRTLVRTTAWTAPAVALTAGAPAFAATGAGGTLNWTFTAASAALPAGELLSCSNLQLTFDNSRSTVALVPTKVVAEANVFGTWHSIEQPNSSAIPAGEVHTMAVDASSYRGFDLKFTITFNDASGAPVSLPTTGNLKTGSCSTKATFTHSSTA